MRNKVRREDVSLEGGQAQRCADCLGKDDMISFLRSEIVRITEDKRRLEDRCEKLTDKLVLFSEKASEQEHRYKMTQLAHMKPVPMEGMLPRDDLTIDDSSHVIDELFDQLSRVK